MLTEQPVTTIQGPRGAVASKLQLPGNMQTNRLLALGLTFAVGLGPVAGCAAPEMPAESHGSTTSKLLKPKPTMKAKASKETTAKYGITEWRMYKQRSGVVLTGYDADGKAVKGVTTSFADSKDTGNPEVVTHINDGSHATLKQSLVASDAPADADVPDESVAFAQQVAGDLGGVQQSLAGNEALPTVSDAIVTCGKTLANLCATAIQCCCGLLFGGWGGQNPVQYAWGAASYAIQSGTQCATTAIGAATGVAVEVASGVQNVDVGVNAAGLAQNITQNPLATGAVSSVKELLADGDNLKIDPKTGEVDFADNDE